jgi:hypothetical protein
VNLLEQHHRNGLRYEPTELVERGRHVVVGLDVSKREWGASANVFKLFTFDEERDEIVLLEDCVDRDDALARAGG